MQIEIQNTKQDYIDFYKAYLKTRFQKGIIITCILLFFVISAFYGDHFSWSRVVFSIIGYGIFIAILSYYLPLFIYVIKLNKLIAHENGYLQKRIYTITDDGLRSEGENNYSLRNWESIKSAEYGNKFIHIKTADKRSLIIPERFFTSQVDAVNFLGSIQSKIRNGVTFTKNHETYKNKSKPPYLIGLLGFIPLIGAFVGIALILYGLIKYKDKWLVLIGIGGIVFTVIVYSSLFYVGFKSKFGREGFATISQMQLNTLVKQVEFYKLQHGNYPDSLQQLDVKNEFVNIHDPIIDIDRKKNDTYNYHRIGNKYTLFSSGLDEVPNTADDIYPMLNIDTSRIGLIIKRK
jgi:hypothetical protein